MIDWIAKPLDQTDIMFAELQGMPYGAWARSPYSQGDLILNPSGFVESLLRDFIHTERDLKLDGSYAVSDYILLPDAKSTRNDFYNGCYINNVDSNFTVVCTDYIAASKRFELATTQSFSTGDNVYLTNVNCNINSASFDAVASSLSSWEFSRVISDKTDSKQLLREALYESFCILVPSYNEYKLVEIKDGTPVGSLSRPICNKAGYQISANLTHPSYLYSDFKVLYGLDYATGGYISETYVNKNGSSNATTLGSAYQTKCLNAETNYNFRRKFVYECKNIYDQTTAELFTQKLVNWHTKQRIRIVGKWAISDNIKYEIGDIVTIDFDEILPASINNSAGFMIFDKTVRPEIDEGAYVEFKLVEVG